MSDLSVKYPVATIFRSFQGEGHFVGYPMAFVRLAGCSNLKCSIRKECDEAPWKESERLDADEILARIIKLGFWMPNKSIVCLTGGEPTDHDLVPLISALMGQGFRIHMETSGVRPVTGYPLEWLTVSPKTPAYVQRTGHVLKVVMRPEWSAKEIDSLNIGTEFFHRYLQPLTDVATGMPVNLVQVMKLLESDWNVDARWALSTQAHRYWGIR